MKQFTIGMFLALALAVSSCGEQEKPKANEAPESAQSESPKSAEPSVTMNVNDPNVVKIAVPTIQCETCAKTIKKGIKDVAEAQEVNVDVDAKTVFVKVSNNTPETQKKLEEAIAKSGYSTPTMQRDSVAYKGLPECCQDGGMEKL